jgi:cyclopropane-fatty-acyl-phospholipid synthase
MPGKSFFNTASDAELGATAHVQPRSYDSGLAARLSPALARQVVSRALDRMPRGELTVIGPDGSERRFGSGEPSGTIELHDERVWNAFLNGSLGLGGAYADGLWDSPDLPALVGVGAANIGVFDRVRERLLPLTRPLEALRTLRRGRGAERARADIAAHYDLGNDLFELMLDPTLTYSSAFFPEPEADLEEAQLAKLELVCEKLELGPDDKVLEIGSGWGSFALYAARTRGCHVTTTTISENQYQYAAAKIAEAGLQNRITLLKDDYRALRGSFRKLVSLEMIEAVGWRGLSTFLHTCARLLTPDGAMLLQVITMDDRGYPVEKASRTFTTEYVFPGGSLPSLAAVGDALARYTDLAIRDVQELTAHYVLTVRRWRERFLARVDELERRGYDERFRRIWLLYLAFAEGGFAQQRTGDFQLLLGKPRYRAPSLIRHAPSVQTEA